MVVDIYPNSNRTATEETAMTVADTDHDPQLRDDSRVMSIYRLLEAWAEQTSEAVAVAAPGHTPLSYAGLLAQIKYVVKTLNEGGVGRDDRVALVLPNGPEMAVAFLAVAAGAISAPLNPGYRASEFEFYLSDLQAKALIIPSGLDSPARAVAQARDISIIELSPVPEAEAGIFTLAGPEHTQPIHRGFTGPDDMALVLHTSGTTSRPKIVALTQANLGASAHNIRNTLALTGTDRCLNVMPLFHIHGLVGALLSSVTAGGSVVCSPGFCVPQFFDWMAEFSPTWYTAVPAMHQALLEHAPANRKIIARRPLRLIRSSSSALPQQVMADLERAFSCPVIEAYGMTEASHQITSNPLPPRNRKPGSVGLSAGSEVSVINEAGRCLPAGNIGEIAIRGVNVAGNCLDDPRGNGNASAGGWYRTGDLGYLDPEGYLFLTGRLKEIINHGGEKISPYEVEAVLRSHPSVLEAVAFAIPHETVGEEVGAAVKLKEKENGSVDENGIQRFAASRLADFKIPRRVFVVEKIPKGPTGKVQRIGLAGKLVPAAGGPSKIDTEIRWAPPSAALEAELAEIWAQVLRVERVDRYDNFFHLGGDSLSAARIINRVRQATQVELSFVSFFETPTVAGMAERIGAGGRKIVGPERPVLKSDAGIEKRPLSYSQQRLWFIDRLNPGDPAYNRAMAYRLTGRLDAEILERSLNEIVRRHAVLRSSFPAKDGEPEQVILQSLSLKVTVTDLRDLPETEREAQAQRLTTEAARRPFDLARGPLLRVWLVRLTDQTYVLLVVTHHIVFDGWSDGILLREMAALYEAFIKRRPSPLPDLPIQFADYAQWQRKRLEGETWEKQLSYWKQRLENCPSLLELPTDRSRPPAQNYRGARHSMTLSPNLTRELKELSRGENVTLFMLLLAVFKTLLYRYSGQEDIVVGVPVAGRSLVEAERVIGNFINTLALRTDLSGDPAFCELLRRVREAALGAYAHQDLPIEKLVEELQVERGLDRNPLFQVMFQLRNLPGQSVSFPDLQVEEVQVDTGTAKLDLALEIVEEDGQLACWFEYNTDLFDQMTIARMGGHFQNLLSGVVADGGQRLSALPLMTEAERHQLLVEWNDTRTNYPRDKCIHQLFEAQAERIPESVAVVFPSTALRTGPSTGSGQGKDKRITYRELNCRANQLAHRLKDLGVGPDVPVGICVERSLEMIVGLLGILKAGGAYVPLDSAYPIERLSLMLEDSRAPVLLTEKRLADRFPHRKAELVCLDADWELIAGQRRENPVCGAAADSLAYVAYTSGSTGKPNGVMITHGSLVNAYLAWEEAYQLRSATTVHLQMANFSFDVFSGDWVRALCSGGKLVLCPAEFLLDAPQLYALARRERVDCAEFVPAVMRNLLQYLEDSGQALDGMRTLVVASDIWRVEEYQKIRRFCGPSTRLINSYGLTEVTIDSSYFAGGVRGLSPERVVPIGGPFANTQLYILDRHLQPVPVGVPGELHIGGAGLARGYLNRPDLTAEKFIPNSFSVEPGARLYKTGDQARRLPDGNIEFLGRIDNQVNIRGFRVELGEIESALSQHPAVCETVVQARQEATKAKRLVAYVVSGKDLARSTSELRGFLKEKLPEHMVPSAFVFLESLPLTPNGKVDRKALPEPDQTRPEKEQACVAPRTPVEEALAGIWCQLLGVERVGVHDDFFELGGHSLLIIQVISRAQKTFGVEVPLRVLFENPTIAGLAVQISEAKAKKASP